MPGGIVAELARLTREQKEAELEVRRLECKVSQASSNKAKDENARQKAADVSRRHAEVVAMRRAGTAELERQREARAEAVRERHRAEAERKKAARAGMVNAFVSRVHDAREARREWCEATKGLKSEAEAEREQLKQEAAAERRRRTEARRQLVTSVQRSRCDSKDHTSELSRTLQDAARERAEAEAEERHRRAMEMRQQSREAVRRARDEIEARNHAEKVALVSHLKSVRDRELQMLRETANRLQRQVH